MSSRLLATAVLTLLAAAAPLPAKQSTHTEPAPPPRTIAQKLGDIVRPVVIDQAPARDAFAWWSHNARIPLVINWRAMENRGVSGDTELNLDLDQAPVGRVLGLLMAQLQLNTGVELIYQATPWYVQVMTKAQANRQPVLRVYDVGGLVMPIPDFNDAPSFDLRSALSNTSTGGGGAGSGGGGDGGLFGDNNDRQDRKPQTRTRLTQGQSLAETIRQTIEPELWRANGGTVASIRYYQGKLIVHAPDYIQQQIGTPRPPAPSLRDRVLRHKRRTTAAEREEPTARKATTEDTETTETN